LTRPTHGGNLHWAATIAGCPESSILDFSASINPLGPPVSAISAIQNNLETLKHYPDPNYTQLKTALAQWHGVDPQWILPGNGSAELLTWVSWELTQWAGTYLLTPAFTDYYRAFETFKLNIYPCPLSPLDGDIPVNPRLTNAYSLGILINNPHNPTGRLFSRASLLPYLENWGLVIVDEAFMDFLPPDQQQSLIGWVKDYPNLVILRSLTKFYSLPGLRLGYAIAHPQRLAIWQKWRDPWPVNSLAAAVTEAVILDKEFQLLTWHWLASAREQLFTGLAGISGLSPLKGAANFLLVKTRLPSSQLQRQLLEKYQILIRDCLSFPELGEDYFRVAVRSEPENQRLIQAIAALSP